MSAMGTLAGELVEFGGDLHTHGGWLARRADGTHVDGYRYAVREAHTCGADCDTPCPGWHWHYVGRAFASEDAATALAEVIADDQLAESAAAIMPPRRADDVPTGRAVWHGATGEWTISYGAASATIGGPGPMSGLVDSLRRHGFTTGEWSATAGRVTGTVYRRAAAP